MRNILGKIAIKAHEMTPNFKGKQQISRLIQRATGTTTQKSKEGILLETRLTSLMDLSYLREGGHSLIRSEVQRLKNGQRFLDIGANVGYFSLLASKAVGTSGIVIAVEPSQRELEILLKNIRQNKAENIAVVSLATAQANMLASLNIEPEHTGLNKISEDSTASLKQPALTTALQQIVPPTLLPIHLAKIDTEGYELFSLLGIKELLEKKAILRIVIEISPEFLKEHGQRHEDIYELLEGYGYTPSNIPTELLEGYGYTPSQHTIRNLKQWDEVFSLTQ